MLYGIDISHWNGNINFAKLNTDFVIMKVSQGTHEDVKFNEYYNACKLPKGVYIYNKVRTLDEAKKEAEFAVKCLQGKTLEYGVWLDLEDASMRHLGKSNLTNIINLEAAILKKAGFSVGIYCNRDWYLNVLDNKLLSALYPFWIARYPFLDNGTMKTSLSPEALKGCKIWQYSSKGKINGINGNVDLNVQFAPLNDNTNPINTKTIDELARDVLNGIYGTGETRKALLGSRYAEVQKRVNEILKSK